MYVVFSLWIVQVGCFPGNFVIKDASDESTIEWWVIGTREYNGRIFSSDVDFLLDLVQDPSCPVHVVVCMVSQSVSQSLS